ncbi:hypothetical protein SUGI_0073000 [Cryptomeria japonica]|nr:hypothetical protein SUGI_0073000 [Cryptomeria japonica]
MILRKNYTWIPLEDGWLKCNFDGCSKGNPSLSGGGGIIRYYKGHMIEGYCANLGRGSNNRAETLVAW